MSIVRNGNLLVMTFLLSAFSVAGANGKTTATLSLPEKLDAIVEEGIDSQSYPGAVLVIGRKDKVEYQKAYGHYTFDASSKAMTMDTLFDMASVSKVVGTASTAMALWEDGKLNLDSPVSNYIKGFDANGKKDVTIRDLMTHVSGLPAYDSPANAKKREKEGVSSADALIAQIASLPLKNPPRTATIYSCLNMLTQARVNENILGGRQDDFISKLMYQPLGMKDTTYRPTEEQLKRTAPTVKLPDGTDLIGKVHDPLANYHSPALHCPGNAGVFSTALDMARFCEMTAGLGTFQGKQIYKPETITTMTAIQTPKDITNVRGLGWDIYPNPPYATPFNTVDGKRAIAHTGYTGTMIWIDMNTGAYMVFLTNRTYPDDNKKSGSGVSKARREIVETILRQQPEYKDYFANKKDDEAGS